jgi:hypothetical protein
VMKLKRVVYGPCNSISEKALPHRVSTYAVARTRGRGEAGADGDRSFAAIHPDVPAKEEWKLHVPVGGCFGDERESQPQAGRNFQSNRSMQDRERSIGKVASALHEGPARMLVLEDFRRNAPQLYARRNAMALATDRGRVRTACPSLPL